jgi:hypothetical protein
MAIFVILCCRTKFHPLTKLSWRQAGGEEMRVGVQRHVLVSFSPGMNRNPFYRRLGGLQGLYGRVRKISPILGFDPRTVQPVATRYTD